MNTPFQYQIPKIFLRTAVRNSYYKEIVDFQLLEQYHRITAHLLGQRRAVTRSPDPYPHQPEPQCSSTVILDVDALK